MDTINKLAIYGKQINSDIRFIGVPKTIDNDLCVTDHTPGYGSAAKYIGVVMKEIIRDATVYGTKYGTKCRMAYCCGRPCKVRRLRRRGHDLSA